MKDLEAGPAKGPFCKGLRPRRRSWQHCRQLGDLLRVAGGVGSDAAAEAVALAAYASFRQ